MLLGYVGAGAGGAVLAAILTLSYGGSPMNAVFAYFAVGTFNAFALPLVMLAVTRSVRVSTFKSLSEFKPVWVTK